MKKILLLSILVFLLSSACLATENRKADKLNDWFSPKANALNTADDLDALINQAASKSLVLLGEASHGTAEFYAWRAEITKRLIKEHGFSFVAVEGDWASIYRLNKYVKHKKGAPSSALEAMQQFSRWPEWMWGNTIVAELIDWMHAYNADRDAEERVGFYGMDVYGQWEAMDDLLAYAEVYMPEHYETILKKTTCFAHFDRDHWAYARATARYNYSCQDELEGLVSLMAGLANTLEAKDEKTYFRAKQNALVLQNAEAYFRLAMQQGNNAWNSRAEHMWLSVKRLFEHYGSSSKGIVWAHNTHVGDADATRMGRQGMVNIGKLSRAEMGKKQVFITGFGTYSGTVNAGSQWESPMQIMTVPNAAPGSIEDAFSQFPHPDFLLVFDEADRKQAFLQEHIHHRAIGVVYNPRNESGNYVPSLLTQRYDAFIFIRHSHALNPVN